MESEDKFSGLPQEVIRKIALNMSTHDIAATCRSSKRFNAVICDNESFWREMVRVDFRQFELRKSTDYTWKYFYMILDGSTLPDIIGGLTPLQMVTILSFLKYVTFQLPETDVQYTNEEFVSFLKNIGDKTFLKGKRHYDYMMAYDEEFDSSGSDWYLTTITNSKSVAVTNGFPAIYNRRHIIYDKLKNIIDNYFFYPVVINTNFELTTAYLDEIISGWSDIIRNRKLKIEQRANGGRYYDKQSTKLIIEELYKAFASTGRNNAFDEGTIHLKRNEEYNRFMKLDRENKGKLVKSIFESPKFNSMSDEDKKMTILKIINTGVSKKFMLGFIAEYMTNKEYSNLLYWNNYVLSLN